MRSEKRLTERGRVVWGRRVAFALTAVLLAFAVALFVAVLRGALGRGEVGYDAGLYLDSARRWLALGDFYYPAQFAGPYRAEGTVMLYPPLALYLFVPLSILPRIAWWVIPLGILAWHVWRCRPAWWAWPIITACLATVPSAAIVTYGNSDLWSAAFIAIGCRRPLASWALAVKPSVLPLALLFARERRWWLGSFVLAVLALPFWAMWADYLAVMRNLQSAGLLYSLNALPWLAVPAIAWVSRSRPKQAILETKEDAAGMRSR